MKILRALYCRPLSAGLLLTIALAAGASRAGAAPGDAASPQDDREIRVRGRVVTLRPDGLEVPVPYAMIEIDDEDWAFGSQYYHCGYGNTDTDGYFDITFWWYPSIGDENMDISVVAKPYRGYDLLPRINVRDPDSDDYTGYRFRTARHDDYTGTDLDVGTIRPPTWQKQTAFFIYATLARGREWILQHLPDSAGLEDSYFVLNWPSNADPGEIPDSDQMQLRSEGQEGVDEFSILSELARFWYHHVNHHIPSAFCNGTCDVGGCSWCVWCAENARDAWELGFSRWLGTFLTTRLELATGNAPLVAVDLEPLALCNGFLPTPTLTAGVVAAFLNDIQDAEQDDHPQYAAGIDALDLTYEEIATVTALDDPETVSEFIDAFHARYPQYCRELWLTAKNCGYDRDLAAPGAPSNLTSSSHPLFVVSTDATVRFTWTPPTDDMSCIDGYGISVTLGGFALPQMRKDIEEVTTYTTEPLAAGTYWFNLRAVDNAGRWSPTYTTYGPFTIADPEPADLEFQLLLGWGTILVPRPLGDATAGDVPLPTSLTGNAAATYWNVAGRNSGALATSRGFSVRLFVDGTLAASSSVVALGGGAGFTRLNQGPVTVRGGRHTFEAMVDGGELIAETDETDNNWAEQWIWSPLQLTAGTPVTRSAPPDRSAGWSAIGPGPLLYYNCDGLRLTTTGRWNAVTVHALGPADDYDCRLHPASSSPRAGDGGFGANLTYSARAAGHLDAVLLNRNVTGNGSWDVGVLNRSGASSQYLARHDVSATHPFGTRLTVPLADGQMILLREFFVSTANTGWIEVLVEVDPAAGPVTALFLDETFATGNLLDFDGYVKTGVTGKSRMLVNVASDGYNCVAAYRDPRDGTAARDVTIEIRKARPDFRPFQRDGWYAPVVPRPAGDGLVGSTPAPLTLTGNAAATWMNLGVINDSPGGATVGLPALLYVDTTPIAAGNFGVLGPFQTNLVNNDGPYPVAGGRHTLCLRLDPQLQLPEVSETNNAYGEQWVWSPLQLALDTPQARPAPPLPEGGFEHVRGGGPVHFNCDGLRTPVFAPSGADGYWGAVAVMPGSASDVDLRLHPLAAGPKAGFAGSLAESFWPAGHSDFVIVDFNQVGFSAFDVGVLGGAGSEQYTAEATRSHHLGIAPHGTFGPYAIGPNAILDVHEAWLEPGVQICRLENVEGTVDWGFSLYPRGAAYHAKSAVVPGGASWQNGPGELESFHVQIVEADYYAFAVWKVGSADLAAPGSYRLIIHTGATGVPGEAPPAARTGIASVRPNPFNPQTTIAYELRQEGAVTLQVTDTRGRRVRTLVQGPQAAGRHEVLWNGRDDDGRAVPSGVYLVELSAGDVADVRKLTLLK